MVNASARYEAIEDSLPPDSGKKHDELIFRAEPFYLMGEVEAVFGIWLVPLLLRLLRSMDGQRWSTLDNMRAAPHGDCKVLQLLATNPTKRRNQTALESTMGRL